MTDLVERLRAGRKQAQGDLVTWWCRNGRTVEAERKAVGVWCTAPTCNHGTRTNAMRPKDEFPNWHKEKTV